MFWCCGLVLFGVLVLRSLVPWFMTSDWLELLRPLVLGSGFPLTFERVEGSSIPRAFTYLVATKLLLDNLVLLQVSFAFCFPFFLSFHLEGRFPQFIPQRSDFSVKFWYEGIRRDPLSKSCLKRHQSTDSDSMSGLLGLSHRLILVLQVQDDRSHCAVIV